MAVTVAQLISYSDCDTCMYNIPTPINRQLYRLNLYSFGTNFECWFLILSVNLAFCVQVELLQSRRKRHYIPDCNGRQDHQAPIHLQALWICGHCGLPIIKTRSVNYISCLCLGLYWHQLWGTEGLATADFAYACCFREVRDLLITVTIDVHSIWSKSEFVFQVVKWEFCKLLQWRREGTFYRVPSRGDQLTKYHNCHNCSYFTTYELQKFA